MAPFVREAGDGPAVVCLHSNASSSAQWRGLTDALSPTRRVLAPDCRGAGRSPRWSHERMMLLEDEVAFLEPVFARAGDGFAVVGHSYGGAVALKSALVHRGRVTALALYEPTLFSLVEALGPSPDSVDDPDTVNAAIVRFFAGN